MMPDEDEDKNEALEPPDDIFNPVVDEERLEEDHDPPASPARPHLTTPKLPPDHPATDTEIDTQELYDEGLTSATDYDAHEEAPDSDESHPLEPEDETDEERKL